MTGLIATAATILIVAGYFVWTYKLKPAAALARELAQDGGPSLKDKARAALDKNFEANTFGLAAVLDPADTRTVRANAEYGDWLARDREPVSNRVSMRVKPAIRNLTAAAPLIAILGFLLPFLGLVLAIAWVITLSSIKDKAWKRFYEQWSQGEELKFKAFTTLEPFIQTRTGMAAKYHYYKWISVPEWITPNSPERFIVTLPAAYVPTDAQKSMLESAWEAKMSPRNAISWGWEWRMSEGQIYIKPYPPIPDMVPLPFPAPAGNPWNLIPLGVNNRQQVVNWDIKNYPHAIVMGRTNGGKSVQLNAILLDILQDPFWSLYIADRKNALDTYTHADGCMGFESSFEGILDMVRNIQAENERRKAILKENGMRKWHDLPARILIDGQEVDRPPLIMLVIEEAIDLLGKEGLKEIDAIKGEIKGLLLKLIATCRSQGIYLIMVIQRPDAEFTGGAFRENIGCRIQVGAMGRNASQMLFETEVDEKYFLLDTTLESDSDGNAIKGRAACSFSIGRYSMLQGYFSLDDDAPLKATLARCNRIRKSGGVSARGSRRTLTVDAEGVNTPVEVGTLQRIIDSILGRFGFEIVEKEVEYFDEEENMEVTRVSKRLSRIEREEAAGDTETEVRPAGVRRLGVVETGQSGLDEDVRARLRERREALQARRALEAAEAETLPSPAVPTRPAGGLPLATFDDEPAAAAVSVSTPEPAVGSPEAIPVPPVFSRPEFTEAVALEPDVEDFFAAPVDEPPLAKESSDSWF